MAHFAMAYREMKMLIGLGGHCTLQGRNGLKDMSKAVKPDTEFGYLNVALQSCQLANPPTPCQQ